MMLQVSHQQLVSGNKNKRANWRQVFGAKKEPTFFALWQGGKMLEKCTICPHKCGIDRTKYAGRCKSTDRIKIALYA